MKKNQQSSNKNTSTQKDNIAVQKEKQVAAQPAKSTDDRTKFLSKCLLILAVVAGIIAFLDAKEYFVGDQINNHSVRKWRSFYRFADEQNKNADIVVFGNSHASAGVEPYVLSMNTGTNCFILNAAGTTVMDAYFNLKEILGHNNKPKLVIVETLCLNISEIGEEWGRIQSFESKKFSLRKVLSMPFIFKPDEWVKAWSPTIRNHSFLLKDSARLAYNRLNVGVEKNPDRVSLDLGRFSHGQNGLQDSTIAKYAKNGAPIKCSESKVGGENVEYLKKLYNLCTENGIEIMLFTAPMYYKTFDNYALQKKANLNAIKDMPKLKWLDLQFNYDTTVYTKDAFNDECHGAQHNTSYGMSLNTARLSRFVIDNYGKILPNRQNDPNWINDFEVQDMNFAFCQNVSPIMKNYKSVSKNKVVGKFAIKELAIRTSKNDKMLILKIENHPDLKEAVLADLAIQVNNQPTITKLKLSSTKEVSPPNHKVYLANVGPQVDVLDVISIQE